MMIGLKKMAKDWKIRGLADTMAKNKNHYHTGEKGKSW